jgi:hypothetical protein
MLDVLLILFVPVFLAAEFKQECRFIRIARNQNLSYRALLAEMAADKPTVIATLLIIASFVALVTAIKVGFRLPDDPLPFLGVGALILAAAVLKGIGFYRLTRSRR